MEIDFFNIRLRAKLKASQEANKKFSCYRETARRSACKRYDRDI